MAGRRKADEDEKPPVAEPVSRPPESSPGPSRPPSGGYVARTPIVCGVGDTRRRFEVGEELSGVDASIIERLLEKDLVKAQ
jgi:hypothetical protein